MEIKVVRVDEELTHLALSGKLDVAGEREIGEDFRDLAQGRGKPVLLDMSQVTYLASLGIRLLFTCAKSLAAKGERLVILNPQPVVEEVLETSGTVGLIPISHGMEHAMKLLKG